MLGRTYERENCSAARALELIGERWSLLIARNAMFANCTRFNHFQRSLGIATNVLAARLDWFVTNGLMDYRPAQDGADGHEYVLTTKGQDLEPVIVALSAWGDRWAAPNGPPILYQHRDCGGAVQQHITCASCQTALRPGDITASIGPGSATNP